MAMARRCTGVAPCCSALDYLPGHTTVDLSVGKDFGENFTVSASGLNVGNRRVMLDDSLTFGGFHLNDPREFSWSCDTGSIIRSSH